MLHPPVPATRVSAEQLPENKATCVLVLLPSAVRIRNTPEAGATTRYQTVFTVPEVQHVGVAGSLRLPEHALEPVRFTPRGKVVALQGRSLDGDDPETAMERL